jgi:geranylgeranyl diphosphate synthase type I
MAVVQPMQARVDAYNSLLHAHVRELFSGPSRYQQLYAMMSYHFGWLDEQLRPCVSDGGKRLRPALCLSACESVGGQAEDALAGAVALELLHNFSLIHDDIEDNSRLRRSRSTVWSLWGVPHGVNVGDAMCALAYLVLCERVPEPSQAVQAVRMLSRANVELCEGQFLDLRYEDVERVDLPDYLAMIGKKTAALFGCSVGIGALLGGASPDLVARLERFGRVLGEAFQIQDDILGAWGDPGDTGKAASDVRDRKRALPAVLAWERCDEGDRTTMSGLYARSGPLGQADVEWVLDLFERLEIRNAAERMKRATLRRAVTLLEQALPGAESAARLHELVTVVAPLDDVDGSRDVSVTASRPPGDSVSRTMAREESAEGSTM